MASLPALAEVTEFCLEGELDLGARYQGLEPAPGDWVDTRWCVLTDDESDRVRFSVEGKSNPDVQGGFTVAFLPPDLVRIVNRDAPPDIEFRGKSVSGEAMRYRRMDPRRLLESVQTGPDRVDPPVGETRLILEDADSAPLQVVVRDGLVHTAETTADLPLRGRVPVSWRWDWPDPDRPRLELIVAGNQLFRGTGRWRTLNDYQVETAFAATSGVDPVQVPGDQWPARVNMRMIPAGEDAWLVRGVRTGFQHLVVRTSRGLVVADAPAGWVELQQLPPFDLVPGLGVSGLAEGLIDFLAAELPGEPILAVAITHAHDDHAGGARAFAAAGAEIYAPEAVREFLESALNDPALPEDRYSATGEAIDVIGVSAALDIADRIRLLPLGESPHVRSSLGILDTTARLFFVSDVHVPSSDAPIPDEKRALTECWFAEWAEEHLDDDVVIVNSHSAPLTPVDRLRQYLETDLCGQ